MTKVAMIFEEEKQEALTQAYAEIVTKMIKSGYSTEEIVSLVKGYSYDDVEILRKKL